MTKQPKAPTFTWTAKDAQAAANRSGEAQVLLKDGYYDQYVIAAMLGVTLKTVREWTADGLLETERIESRHQHNLRFAATAESIADCINSLQKRYG